MHFGLGPAIFFSLILWWCIWWGKRRPSNGKFDGKFENVGQILEPEVVVEEAIELVKEGLELAIYGQNNTKHLEGCPNVPMTCMRCVYDEDRKRFEVFLTKHGASDE